MLGEAWGWLKQQQGTINVDQAYPPIEARKDRVLTHKIATSNQIKFILVVVGVAGFVLAVFHPECHTGEWGAGLLGVSLGVFANWFRDHGKLEVD